MAKKRFSPLSNPFPLIGYNGPLYFCDREKELDKLMEAINNGRNVSLIARRRLGKSALLEHLIHTLNQKSSWTIIYIDLIKTSSMQELYKILAQSIYESRSKGFLSKISEGEIMGRLRITLSVNPITQLPDITIDLKEGQVNQSITSLLNWLASNKRTLIVFDEFQQILSYQDKNIEGFLRSEMMRLPNIRFIFSGSDQHILEDMFRSPSRPFYNSTQNLPLLPIDAIAYKKFISNHFKKSKRTISTEALDFILFVSDGETFAVQKICNAIYSSGIATITLPIAKEIFARVLDEQQTYYERIRALLGANSVQFALLRAISRSGEVSEITGAEFMKAHQFSNSSSIFKAIRSLEGYQLVSKKVNAEGKMAYFINDALFKSWLNTLPN